MCKITLQYQKKLDMVLIRQYAAKRSAEQPTAKMSRAVAHTALIPEKRLMPSLKAVSFTSEGVLVPWSHRELIAVIEQCEPPSKCSSCGLLAGVTVLGYGPDGDVCFDCNKKSSEQMQQRLRDYRVA
jgi:hypothetical protein